MPRRRRSKSFESPIAARSDAASSASTVGPTTGLSTRTSKPSASLPALRGMGVRVTLSTFSHQLLSSRASEALCSQARLASESTSSLSITMAITLSVFPNDLVKAASIDA